MSDDEKKPLSRRDFLRLAWGSAATSAADALARGVEDMEGIFPRSPRREFSGRVYMGAKSDLARVPVGGALTGYASTEHFFLVRSPEGWLALHNRCTAGGCRLTWQPADGETPARLTCWTDGSIYDLYGEVAGGPAPYPLALLSIEEDTEGVYVRTDALRSRVTVDRKADPVAL